MQFGKFITCITNGIEAAKRSNSTCQNNPYRPEIVHVWKDAYVNGGGPTHSAQMVVDGVSYLSETVYSIGSQPTKILGDWIADKIAPSYWKPNNEIVVSKP